MSPSHKKKVATIDIDEHLAAKVRLRQGTRKRSKGRPSMKIDQSTMDWDWVKNIRAGSGVGMKIDRASVAFRAADAGHLDTILTVRNVLRNGCKRPSTTLYWARWQNRYIFIVDKETILNGVETS